MIIPTIDTVRYNYLIQLYLSRRQPILLAGLKASGKTMNANNSFETINRNEFSFLNINMTAQTTSNDVQEMIEEKLEKRTKELYIPLTGTYCNFVFLRIMNNIIYIHFSYFKFKRKLNSRENNGYVFG